jgi:hypothetical protein
MTDRCLQYYTSGTVPVYGVYNYSEQNFCELYRNTKYYKFQGVVV